MNGTGECHRQSDSHAHSQNEGKLEPQRRRKPQWRLWSKERRLSRFGKPADDLGNMKMRARRNNTTRKRHRTSAGTGTWPFEVSPSANRQNVS